MWLQSIKQDHKQQNLGLKSAWHIAYDCGLWRRVIEMATSLAGACHMVVRLLNGYRLTDYR